VPRRLVVAGTGVARDEGQSWGPREERRVCTPELAGVEVAAGEGDPPRSRVPDAMGGVGMRGKWRRRGRGGQQADVGWRARPPVGG
jgi:hypothetical protein